MASVVFRDTTGAYDGSMLESRPLGGTESSVIRLSRELAARGHHVVCYTNCERAIVHAGVHWRPLGDPAPDTCDLYVPVQHARMLSFVRRPRRRAIWVLWQPNHLKHYKNLPAMWLYRPVPVLMSLHQVRIYSSVLPRRDPHILVPLGLPDEIRGLAPLPAPPPPNAIFASNPQRNLRQLLEIWSERVFPRLPQARLNVYGIKGAGDGTGQGWAAPFLPAGLSPEARDSIVFHADATRAALIEAMRGSRVMPYLGHKVEAFCLALAEAQALGVPAVVAPVAVLPERVIDGVTGFVHADLAAFADSTLALLSDDTLWRRQHEAALRFQQGLSWRHVATRFENALLGDMVPTFRSEAAPASAIHPQPDVVT